MSGDFTDAENEDLQYLQSMFEDIDFPTIKLVYAQSDKDLKSAMQALGELAKNPKALAQVLGTGTSGRVSNVDNVTTFAQFPDMWHRFQLNVSDAHVCSRKPSQGPSRPPVHQVCSETASNTVP